MLQALTTLYDKANGPTKLLMLALSAYAIFRAGTSVGEFIYYMQH